MTRYYPIPSRRTCPVCKAEFTPRVRKQITCGSYNCRRTALRHGNPGIRFDAKSRRRQAREARREVEA